MILLFASYAIIALVLIGGALFLRGMARKVSLYLTMAFVVLPLCFLTFLGVFKSEIQQGKILPGLSPFLILVAPPQDLWVPLGSHNLAPSIREYKFKFQHKYAGNHVVELKFKKLDSMEIAQNNFEVQYTVFDDGKNIFTQTSQKGWPYWGVNDSGLIFISYTVPQALPVAKDLTATVKIIGNIELFIQQYSSTLVIIRKGSDL